MIMLTESAILKHVSNTESTTIKEISDRLGFPKISPKLVRLIFKMCNDGVLEFIETEKSVVRPTISIEFPENAFTSCQCRSEIRCAVREYTTGKKYWLFCGECGAYGLEGIEEYKLDQLCIPNRILSEWMSNLVYEIE